MHDCIRSSLLVSHFQDPFYAAAILLEIFRRLLLKSCVVRLSVVLASQYPIDCDF